MLDEDDNSGAGANFRVTARVTPGIYYIGVMGSSITTTGFYELSVAFSATATPLPTGDRMYWTDQATDKIQRANLDGSAVEDLVSGLASPEGIAIHDGRIYWTDSGTERIQRSDLDGFEGFSDGHWQRPHSNVYATLRRNTGSVRLRMSADPGVRITVVVKE